MGTRRTLGTVVLVLLGAAIVYYGGGGARSHSAAPGHSGVTTEQVKAASADLSRMRPRPGTGMRGYDRARFGPEWADVDHNSCRTRDDILARDLTGETLLPDHCTVLRGSLQDPYTGRTIRFVRGVRTSAAVQIDHVVPLGWAWSHGASTWIPTRREAYANDPAVLLAVDGPANEAKGDSGPADWMPPSKADACAYDVQWVRILTKYRLHIDAADKAALTRTLKECSWPSR